MGRGNGRIEAGLKLELGAGRWRQGCGSEQNSGGHWMRRALMTNRPKVGDK
jgi:hypothetical protein